MKKITLSTLFILALAITSFAQSWQKFNYQGVARNAQGEVVENQAIGVRISLHEATANGAVVYQETHVSATNEFGLFDLAIGDGTVVSGDFGTIDWGNNDYYIQVEMDVAGGVAYADMGTSQLLSVPYAMYAANAGVPGVAGPTGPMGPAGATGPAGPTGPEGPLVAGASGETLRNDGSGWVASPLLHNSGDHIGIGTDDPISDLDIQQTGGAASSEGTGGINMRNGNFYWRMYNSNNYLRFNYSDDSGASYTAKSYINPTDGSWNQVSDASMKRDVDPLKNVLSSVMKLNPVEYYYIDNKPTDKKAIGFLAQDAAKLFPNTVSREEGETLLGIDYNKFAVIAIKAIQEQQELIEELQKEIELLKKK